MKRLLLPLVVLLTLGVGCSRHRVDSEPVVIERFDLDVRGYQQLDSARRDSFMVRYADVVGVLRGLMALPDGIADGRELMEAYSESRGLAVFGRAVADSLPRLETAERQLGLARRRLSDLKSPIVWPKVYGVVSTYNQAVLTTESAVFVALNHFLGEDYEGYGYFERYQRRMKRSDLIAGLTVEAVLSARYPYRASDESTAVTRMIYDGALTLATARLVAERDVDEDLWVSRLLGWTSDQWNWAVANERQAWLAMIDRQYVYSQSQTVAERLTLPSPATTLLHRDAPGRMGTYIGQRIVRAWLDCHRDSTVMALLDSALYNSPTILIDSRYSP